MSYNNPPTFEDDGAREYYKEVLLSYRLIFGHGPGSAEDFKRRAYLWAPALGELSDPILAILCGENWESEKAYPIYYEIQTEDTAERYSPSEDFPYLGKRLLKIQEYVNDHRPNNLRQLWHDQANKWNWWMLWAFVILGCLALLFSIIQVRIVSVRFPCLLTDFLSDSPPTGSSDLFSTSARSMIRRFFIAAAVNISLARSQE